MFGWLNRLVRRDTSQGTPREFKDVKREYPRLNASATTFLTSFGPFFTHTAEGHIQTDIAGAASVAGAVLLRATVPDLDRYPVGQAILSEVHDGQSALLRFMEFAALGMGLDGGDSWGRPVPPSDEPLFSVTDMVDKLQHALDRAAWQAKVRPPFYGHVAALTAMKLVAAGHLSGLLDQAVGKALAAYYLVAGSKTVPPPFDRRPAAG